MDVLEILRILVYLYIKVTNYVATDANFKVILKLRKDFLVRLHNARVTFKFSSNVTYVKVTHD